MKEIRFEYQFMVFLCAYFRQADLSLDRCRWTSWKELQLFYEERIQPSRIISYLKKRAFPGDDNDVNGDEMKGENFFVSRLKFLFARLTNWHFLTTNEYIYTLQLLVKLDNALKSDTSHYSVEFEKLRIEIAVFKEKLIVKKLKVKDVKEIQGIDHYLEHSANKSVPINFYLKTINL